VESLLDFDAWQRGLDVNPFRASAIEVVAPKLRNEDLGLSRGIMYFARGCVRPDFRESDRISKKDEDVRMIGLSPRSSQHRRGRESNDRRNDSHGPKREEGETGSRLFTQREGSVA
jgi:hypothetical protein